LWGFFSCYIVYNYQIFHASEQGPDPSGCKHWLTDQVCPLWEIPRNELHACPISPSSKPQFIRNTAREYTIFLVPPDGPLLLKLVAENISLKIRGKKFGTVIFSQKNFSGLSSHGSRQTSALNPSKL